jgi:plastocyanin
MRHLLVSRRWALATVGQLGLALAAAACAPASNSQPSSTATAATAQSTATPARSVSPSASPAAVASPQSSPVVGAAPLPLPPPTPGGGPPTPVGVSGSPVPQPNAVAVASPSPSAQPVAASVAITADRQFSPALISVSRGQTVQWRNQSRSPQTVTCNPALASNASDVSLPGGAQAFDSGVINPNGTFSYTFSTPGSYQYLSLPFEAQKMFGQITVE